MEFTGIIFALFYAIILTAIFSLIFRNTGPWNGFWIFFFLLFFIALGAGEWATPVGPIAWGYNWVPGLIAAIIFALVIVAAAPLSGPSQRIRKNRNKGKDVTTEKIYEEEETTAAAVAIGIFFWILIAVLIVVAISGIVNFHEPF